jgi:hypothetical protein
MQPYFAIVCVAYDLRFTVISRSRFDDMDIEEQAEMITQIMWPVVITMVIVRYCF